MVEKKKTAKKREVKLKNIKRKVVILGDHDMSSPLRLALGWFYSEEYKLSIGLTIKGYEARVNLSKPFYSKKIKSGKYKRIEKAKKNIDFPRAKVTMTCWDLSCYVVQEMIKKRNSMAEIEAKIYGKFKDNCEAYLEAHAEEGVYLESIIGRIGHTPFKFEKFLRATLSEFIKTEQRLPLNVKELIKYARGRYYFVEVEPKKGEDTYTLTTPTSKIRTDFSILRDKFPNENEAVKFREFLKEQVEDYGEAFITELRSDATDFRSLLRAYHKGTDAVIITADIENEESILDLIYWAKFCHEALEEHGKSLEIIPLIFVIETHGVKNVKRHRNYNAVKGVMDAVKAPIALINNEKEAKEIMEFLARIMYENIVAGGTGKLLEIDEIDEYIHEGVGKTPSLNEVEKRVEKIIEEDEEFT